MPPSSPVLRPSSVAALSALVISLAGPAAAQPEPRLPSLTPGVFESRGTAPRVSLPDIPRQPLTGLTPPPRTWVVPEDREPATAPFAPDPDGLPELVLDAPPAPEIAPRESRHLRLEAGGGLQYARYARVDLATTGESAVFLVDADYEGLDRRSTPAYTGHDRYRVAASGQSLAAGRLSLGAHAAHDSYSLLAASQRRRSAWGGFLGSEGVGRTPFRVRLGYDYARLYDADGAGPETTEGRMDLAASVAPGRVRLDAAGGASGAGSAFGTDIRYGSVGAAVALGRPDGARATLGVRAMGFDASTVNSAQAVGPVVDLHLPLRASGLAAFAVNDPRVAVRSLGSLTDALPFLLPGPAVVPDVIAVDARAGLALDRGAVRARVFGTALVAPTYLTVIAPGGSAFLSEAYVDARAFGVGADLAVGTSTGVTGTAAVEVRRGRTDTGLELGLFAPVVGQAGVQVPVGRVRLGLSAYGEAERPDGTGGTAPAWGRARVEATYAFPSPFAVVLAADRLVGTAERWPGFPEAPYTVTLGLRLTR